MGYLILILPNSAIPDADMIIQGSYSALESLVFQ